MRFGPQNRMRKSREFVRVRRMGRRSGFGAVRLSWLSRGDAGPARVGLAVRRGAGGAVGRNRARRVLREAFRAAVVAGEVPTAVDVVLHVKPEVAWEPSLFHDVRRALRRLGGGEGS